MATLRSAAFTVTLIRAVLEDNLLDRLALEVDALSPGDEQKRYAHIIRLIWEAVDDYPITTIVQTSPQKARENNLGKRELRDDFHSFGVSKRS